MDQYKNDIRKNIRDHIPDPGTLNIDTFGKMMDDIIEGSSVALLIHKEPHGKWQVKGGAGGPVMDFYVLLNAVAPIYKDMLRHFNGGIDGKEVAKALAEVLREELTEAAEEVERDETGTEEN